MVLVPRDALDMTATFMIPDALLELGTAKHRAGDLAQARRFYEQVLAAEPGHDGALFRMGLLELHGGRPGAALELIRGAVAATPDAARYHFGLGEALAATGRWDDAAGAYERFLVDHPDSAEAHLSLGMARQAQGRRDDAIVAYQSALHIQPDFAPALTNLGNCHHLGGDLDKAEAAYRQAIAAQPTYAGAISNLGVVLQKRGSIDAAVAHFQRAMELEPLAAAHAVNLGAALCQQRKFAQAQTLLRETVERDANNAEAAYNLGNALQGLGQPREAADQYRRAVTLRPAYAEALNNLGNIHKALGESSLALAAYEAAIAAQPGSAVAFNNLSCALRTLGRLDEAEHALRRGLAIEPNHSALYDNLGSVLKDGGRLDEAIECFGKSLAIDPTNWATHSNLAYALSFSSFDPRAILDECRRWNQRYAEPINADVAGEHAHPDPCRCRAIDGKACAGRSAEGDRRLRIGYISPNFREHCQSFFTIPLLSNQDHTAFEIFCYCDAERTDDLTQRIRGYADGWRNIRAMDDEAVARMIRADGIDVLIDLTMHMADGRPLVFARKPAPVQIAWLAYPGTTGLGAMDYRLSDARLDPPQYDGHYTEKTIRLPDAFWCYDPLTYQPTVNELPALSRGQVTFGCLNNPCKLTCATLALWGEVMRALPGARLLLMCPPGESRRHLAHRLAMKGIGESRVRFVPYRPRADYLRTYHEIDIGLDTTPYNGHTTSLDSFWMGVPVVTRVGQTCVGRGGLSQLFHLDLLDLAANTDEQFTRAAIALASDLPRLASLRGQLRSRLERSALMDGRRFARAMEAVYRVAHAKLLN